MYMYLINYNIHTVSLVARTSIANPQGLGEDRSFAGGLYFWMLRCISAAWIFFLSDIYAFSSIFYSHKSHDEGEEEGFIENGGMERGEGRLARVCLFLPFWLPYQHLYTKKRTVPPHFMSCHKLNLYCHEEFIWWRKILL